MLTKTRLMRHRPAFALLAVGLTWSADESAHADEKAACLAAHEHGQEMRLAHRWIEAQRLFLVCAQPRCPTLVVEDCTRWELELGPHIPSVVVSAKRADGVDLDDVSVTIDGVAMGPRLPVVAIPLNPGEHLLHFEHFGWPALETRVTLRDGEHDRRIDIRLAPPSDSRLRRSSPTGPPAGAYVTMGIGAAAAITSVVLLLVGKIDEHNLATSPCGQTGTCTNGQVTPIRTDYIVSGVAAGVAVAAVGLTVWQLIAHKGPAASSAWLAPIEF